MYIRNVFSGLLRIRKTLKPTAVPSQFAWTTENKYAELCRTRVVQRQKIAEPIEAEDCVEPDEIAAEVTISQTQAYDSTKEYGHSSNEAADKLSAPVCKLLLNRHSTLTISCSIMQEFIRKSCKIYLRTFNTLVQMHTTCPVTHIAVISYLSQINFL